MKTLILITVLSSATFLFAEEVSISVDDKSLKGELNISEKNTKQIAFIISGSGPTDRDGNTAGLPGKSNSLLYLSNYLNKERISTLRVDKRGIGASASAVIKEDDLRFTTYVEDVGHWIDFLKKKGYSEIILIGHSEGALVATLAAKTESVTGLISIAGAGRPAATALKEQLKPNLPKELYSEAERIISSLVDGKIAKDIPPELNALFRPSVQAYLISWFKIDPAKAISEIQVPVLIVQGSTDIQTSTKDAKLLNTGAKGSELIIIEGMNHVLKAVEGDLAAQTPSYLNPDLPIHKDLGAGIIEFIKNARSGKAAESTTEDEYYKLENAADIVIEYYPNNAFPMKINIGSQKERGVDRDVREEKFSNTSESLKKFFDERTQKDLIVIVYEKNVLEDDELNTISIMLRDYFVARGYKKIFIRQASGGGSLNILLEYPKSEDK